MMNGVGKTCVCKSCVITPPLLSWRRRAGGKDDLGGRCSPCPIGQRLLSLGAKKIIGLDVSLGMLEIARKNLTEMKIVDKFEVVCSNILDDDFQL